MTRFTTLAAACVLAVAASVSIAQAQDRSKWFKPYEITYIDTYERGHEAGLDVGANLVDDALTSGEKPSQARVEESTARIQGWLNPPESAPAATTYEPAATTYAPPATSSGGCPASMAPESGSAGYSAYNPSSGAAGCYQVIPSTWAAHCSDLGTDPAGQDACAARICSAQGPGAWAASGANPC